MNLSKVKTKLFKATIANIAIGDAYGIHIGDHLPPKTLVDTFLQNIEELYVAGHDIKEVVDVLTAHKINILCIEEVNILLNVDKNDGN